MLLLWTVVAATWVAWTWDGRALPGLYMDEAIPAGLAKEFVTGRTNGEHVPGVATTMLLGRPLPLFVQPYCGALKAWLLIPPFALFGATLPVLRWTGLACSLAALLILVLWARRLLGPGPALLVGALLGLDPTFYFISASDWGPVAPGFLTRMAGFYCLLRWWREDRSGFLALGAFAFGLAFFNKVDAIVILVQTGVAAAITWPREILARIRTSPRALVVAGVAFAAGAGPMLWRLREILRGVQAGRVGSDPNEWFEKIQTTWSMYDGSHFYRLMDVGGRFDRMYDAPAPVWTPFLGLLLGASLVALWVAAGRGHSEEHARLARFLLWSTVLVSLGALVLPGAIRVHHTTLVVPWPHLLVAFAAARLWEAWPSAPAARWGTRLATAAAIGALLLMDLRATERTRDLIAATGGRGRWSDALHGFAEEVRGQEDLTVLSMDWGFHEPLLFLSEGPRWIEPTWQLLRGKRLQMDASSRVVYLVHPPEYAYFPFGNAILERAAAAPPGEASVRPYRDRQGRIAFYAVRFEGP